MWSIFSGFSNDMGIDLGTANTLVHVKGQGVVLNEPSVIAVRTDTGEVLAVGEDAKRMLGRTPDNVRAVRPIKDGVIADFDLTEAMLKYFIKKAMKSTSFFSPRVLVGVPSGVTEVEKRAVIDAAQHAGAKEAYLIEEPMAAAIGAGLPVEEAIGSMVVDIGGGTTEIAVISSGGISTSSSIRIAGDEMDIAIQNYIKRKYSMLIGERTAEKIKMEIGAARTDKDFTGEEPKETKTIEVGGGDLISGIPKTITLTEDEVCETLVEPVYKIIEAVKNTLERTPPELASDIIEHGIVMTGGGALLHNLDKTLYKATGIPVIVADDPLSCVGEGAGKVLSNTNLLKRITLSSNKSGQ